MQRPVASRFHPSVSAAVLAATTALVTPALAQVRGQVGQSVEPMMPGATLRPGPIPASLPNLEETNRDHETQRRAREAARATANAGAMPVRSAGPWCS